MSDSKFDLTTQDGRNAAASYSNVLFYLIPGYTEFKIIKWATEKIIGTVSSVNDIEKQSEMLEKLIKAGKENNADYLEITVDNKIGASFSCPIEDADISTTIGANGKVVLKVKYK